MTLQPYQKTVLAPGSGVVTKYFEKAGLQAAFDKLGFNTAGYGCMVCIGNTGELHPDVIKAIEDSGFVASAVLSGNRNFEGRIHALTKANYLASPALVIAYSLAGTMDIDFDKEPLGKDSNGKDVFLHEIWPSRSEVKKMVAEAVNSD
jgi:aconitate hydratase